MTEPDDLRRHAAPVIAAEALLVHEIGEGEIQAYLVATWLLTDAEARSAISAARALRRDPSALTALPPDHEPK
jgi:hypothetical protein